MCTEISIQQSIIFITLYLNNVIDPLHYKSSIISSLPVISFLLFFVNKKESPNVLSLLKESKQKRAYRRRRRKLSFFCSFPFTIKFPPFFHIFPSLPHHLFMKSYEKANETRSLSLIARKRFTKIKGLAAMGLAKHKNIFPFILKLGKLRKINQMIFFIKTLIKDYVPFLLFLFMYMYFFCPLNFFEHKSLL